MLETRTLGRTGIEVTALGLGAWGIGGKSYGPVERKQAIECIETYLEAGGNARSAERGSCCRSDSD